MYGCTSTANSSPSRRYSCGFFPAPTPAGVPVMMTVPAGSVVPCERKLTIFGISKIKSLAQALLASAPQALETQFRPYSIPQSCRTFPFFNPRICNFFGSGTSDEDARTGPMGHAPSKPLLKHHWLCENWLVRLDTSFAAV